MELNIAGITGDDFYVFNSPNIFRAENVTIDSTFGHQSIYAMNVNIVFYWVQIFSQKV